MVWLLLRQQSEYTKYPCFFCLDRDRIILPPLHIILSLMRQFVTSLDKSENGFRYICQHSTGLSIEKVRAEWATKLVKDENFIK